MTIIWATLLVSVLVLLLIFANFSAFCKVFTKLWYLYDIHEETAAAQEAHHHANEQAQPEEVQENKSEKSG